MSGPNNTPTSHPHSFISLPPLQIPPCTPPTESQDMFWPLNTATSAMSNRQKINFDFQLPVPDTPPRSSQAVYSPLHSPRIRPTFVGTEVFPELARQPLPNEVVQSPLHAPTVSPLMYSPTAPSASQTSLNMQPPIRPEHYTVPSIDPTSSMPGRKLSEPIDTMSPNTITQLKLGMQKDEEAYTWMIERMMSHGWSSPAEIRNLETQRDASRKRWERKINGAKRVLAGLNKCGFPAYQFPEHRSTRSMDSVRSDFSMVMGPCILAGPDAKYHRTYSR